MLTISVSVYKRQLYVEGEAVLLLRIINLLRGYVVCEITGYFIEKFINMVTKKGIIIWGIRRQGKNVLKMNVKIKDFKKLRIPARSTGVRVRIRKKKGLPFILHKYRKRKGVYLGFFVFLAIIFIMSGYIWSIDIVGNENVSDELIMKTLNDSGFKTGILNMGINLKDTKEQVLAKVPELSWIAINIKGSKAVVEVKERIMPLEKISKDTPCNIIAKHDGIIIRADVYEGVSKVKPGYAVAKGSLLISGVLDSAVQGTRLVHAEGLVKAKTEYILKSECPLLYKENIATGKVFYRRSLHLFNFDIKLYLKDSIPYKLYDKISYKNEVKIGEGVYLPIAVNVEKFTEKREETSELSEEEAKKRTQEDIAIKERTELEGKEITNRSLTFKNENGVIYAECVYECIEDIGEESLVENEDGK